MGNRWKISWWDFTGEYGPVIGNVSTPIMRNLDTGALLSQRDLPFGACYPANRDAQTLEIRKTPYVGADGFGIACVVPSTTPPDLAKAGTWYMDHRASNCTKPGDWSHRCWVRHGTIGSPNLTINKDGNTCAAGAGSIQYASWHGFLQNGELYGD